MLERTLGLLRDDRDILDPSATTLRVYGFDAHLQQFLALLGAFHDSRVQDLRGHGLLKFSDGANKILPNTQNRITYNRIPYN